MAKNDKDKKADDDVKPAGSNKLIVIILIVLLLVVVGVGAALFFMMNKSEPPPTADGAAAVAEALVAQKTPIYVPLHPAFLANFEDQSSAAYLQVEAQVLTYDSAVEEAIKLHMPQIRNDLLLLFSSQIYEEVNTVKGKRELSKKSAEAVSKVLKDSGSPSAVEAFLFTSFVIQ
jgi:flagellar FliL protein